MIKMKKWRINWNKRKSYILPILFMVLIIGLTWLLFFHYDIINDKEQKITVIIGFLAINFGLFQFWINEINIEKREKFNLRYSSDQEVITLMETLVEIVNTQMVKKTENEIDYHSLTSAILNQVNKITSLININDKYLFPGIRHLIETGQILDILEKILINTDKLRIE